MFGIFIIAALILVLAIWIGEIVAFWRAIKILTLLGKPHSWRNLLLIELVTQKLLAENSDGSVDTCKVMSAASQLRKLRNGLNVGYAACALLLAVFLFITIKKS